MGSVNTPATPTTLVTSTQYHISPHTLDIPTPRMRSVNTPATPTTCVTSTQSHISPYAGYTNAGYRVCQHAGYSYDKCDLNTISQNPSICRYYYHRRMWGLLAYRIILRHVGPHNHRVVLTCHQYSGRYIG
ncbi:unnamed protein product [Prunus armeniaca]